MAHPGHDLGTFASFAIEQWLAPAFTQRRAQPADLVRELPPRLLHAGDGVGHSPEGVMPQSNRVVASMELGVGGWHGRVERVVLQDGYPPITADFVRCLACGRQWPLDGTEPVKPCECHTPSMAQQPPAA